MSDPALVLDALIADVRVRALPRLSLVDAERHLSRLTQPTSAPPMSIPPPPATVAPPPLTDDGPWSAPPIELTDDARMLDSTEHWAEVDPETAAPPSVLPDAPSVAPSRVAPPPLKASQLDPPRLIIISEPPPDSMFSLADLEEDERGAGASISEIISPITPPPLPSDSISEAIAEAAELVRGKRDDVIDLDASSIELVFMDDETNSKA